ncbi:MAG: hypothetical protein F2681_01290 [Actinobacteria bacterium]|jgi:hypothetical protein|uniref:Unannotated protein n=1 Tax=freshwater metagenome TaxID=449393 RepID=A0A6J6YEV4_9ZZZZ|nr:hypothetical protein [Actinomycetota bacterium]MSX55568.1 hypothetical protein [Actinomycetota bacterium]MSX92228.1 hypothetical protein [Actinomycetota bacterium]MSZ81759.1 hypothetical protein [Actinomycetota bacterium]MTB18306.1 hypothetical protein [Actinomycetota bacterium]
MANNEGTPTPSDDEALELETFDADHDGKIGLIDGYRATLGLVDAELEIAADKAEHKGVKGHLADAAHKLVDKLDND